MEKQPLRLEMRQFKQFFVLGFIFVLLLFGFQNCGETLEESDQLSSLANSAPYPYNAKVNRVAFMSCQNVSGYDTNAFFSFRVQADESGAGLMLRQEFLNATGGLGSTQRAQVIQQQVNAANGHVQTAVRRFSNFQETFLFGSQSRAGFDYSNYSLSVGSPAVSDVMAAEISGNYVHSFGATMQWDLDFLQSSQIQSVVDKLDSGEGFLSTSFSPNNGSIRAVGPSNSTSSSDSIYGQGLIAGFSRPSHISSGAKNIMTAVDEFDTENRRVGGSWSCPSSLRFLIVRDVDRGRDVICNASPTGADIGSSSVIAELRKVLPESDWAIDVNNMCIVAKKAGTCYGTNSLSLDIAYPGNSATTCDPNQNNCPHYVSVCYK